MPWYVIVRDEKQVAQIAMFADGSCAMRWLSNTPSTVVWDDLDHIRRVHVEPHSQNTRLLRVVDSIHLN